MIYSCVKLHCCEVARDVQRLSMEASAAGISVFKKLLDVKRTDSELPGFFVGKDEEQLPSFLL